MPGFLDLPFEIRSSIILLVIHAGREHPTQYTENANRESRRKDDIRSWLPDEVPYEADPRAYVTSAYGLLGGNKQLNRETVTLLAKLPTVYKIDVGFMQGRMLWPTWTCLPRKTTNVDIVEATIQARGPGNPCLLMLRRGGWEWWFYTLIEHFLEYGIRGPPQTSASNRDNHGVSKKKGRKQSQRSRHVIQILDVNCVEPDKSHVDLPPVVGDLEIRCDTTYPCVHCNGRCRQHLRDSLDFRGRTLRNMLSNEMHFLLRLTEDVLFYGWPLYESIGKIRFRLNGKLTSEIDLNDLLVKLPDQLGRIDISQRRKEAILSKKDLGFAIPDNVPQYTEPTKLWQEMQESEDREEPTEEDIEQEGTVNPAKSD